MNGFMRLFEQRVRGIRLIELVGVVLVFALIFWVCVSKAREGEDIRRISDLDRQIAEEQEAVGALKIKVAQLERPGRLEQLAVTYLGMKPVEPNHEARLESLGEISRATARPVAGNVAAPAAAPAATATVQVGSQDDLIAVKPAVKSEAH
ncbi:Cell division protein FtsL [Asticcacaulis sp. MM231]